MEHGLFRMSSRVVGYSCSFSSVYPPKAVPVSKLTQEFVSQVQITIQGSVLIFLVQTPLSSIYWNDESDIKLLSLWQTPSADIQTGQAGITTKGRFFSLNIESKPTLTFHVTVKASLLAKCSCFPASSPCAVLVPVLSHFSQFTGRMWCSSFIV